MKNQTEGGGLALPLQYERASGVIVDANDGNVAVVCRHKDQRAIEAAYALVRAANHFPALLALVERYASECAECNGSGTEYYRGYGNEQLAGTCHACADLRQVLAAVREGEK